MPDDTPAPPRHAVPQWTPTTRELDDLELLINASLAPPLDGFVDPGAADVLPITLTVPKETADQVGAARHLDLIDPEGAPLARLAVTGTWNADDGCVGLVGPVRPLAHKAFGPFRRLHLAPADIRAEHRPDSLLAVAVTRPLTSIDIAVLRDAAQQRGKDVLLLACIGDGMPQGVSGPALVRTTRAAAALVGRSTVVVAVAAASHRDAETDSRLLASVAQAYATETLELAQVPDEAAAVPDEIAAIVRKDRPPRCEQGLVVFFTGLSGSGKSTLARALVDTVLERGERTVTSLDGDVVRHHLSKGLGFSREDRETNIVRIGFVAAEIARHGGMAVCSPIAPFESTRAEVRRMVERAGGGFVLIHVATPLAECERRDRKGLYAKARAGLIPDFTGISSPYEEPINVLKVDTTDRDIVESLQEILVALTAEGWLSP